MQRVERHIIMNSKDLDNITFLSKNLYNFCTYYMRQSLFKKVKYFGEYELSKLLTEYNQDDYRALPSQTAQQVIKLVFKNWKSYYISLKAYKKNPKKYLGSPKMPKYKKKIGHNIVIFTNQQVRIKDGFINFPKKTNIKPLKTKVNNINQVRIIPKSNHFIIEVVYEKNIKEHKLNENLYLSIDLGVNNLISTSNNAGLNPIIINGKQVKAINQFYNKKKAELMSFIGNKGTSKNIEKLTLKRDNKINDYFHKTTKYIINYCIDNEVKNIVVGYNKGWKQKVNIGKKNNQKFVSIPYLKLINQLKYKAEENNILVILNEESYTSKCSALDLEPIKKHENYVGKRVKRGLFKGKELINSDINGSLNILRKVIGDGFINLLDRGQVLCPTKINIPY